MASTRPDLAALDAADQLNWTRGEFEIPDARACGGEVDGQAVYFCGNSLGLLSKRARRLVQEEMDVWGSSSVTGHFNHPHSRPWKHVDAPLTPLLAEIVGAKEEEVAHTSTLTSNMHNLFCSFYRPTPKRWKIVIEKGSFPSDWYAVHSHPRLHDDILSEEQIIDAIISLAPREGEDCLRTEDILATLEQHKDTIAVVWMPLVQYYTGQLFDIAPIAAKAHEIGALIGLDMAHGIGNVECRLNEWEVDFAVWCTYKYLNAGPAAIGGYYIRTGLDDGGRRLAGWWGNTPATRFHMSPTFSPTPGAKGYQHSCTPVLSSIPLLATLELFHKVSFPTLRQKAIQLTNTLESLLRASPFHIADSDTDSTKVGFRILTPEYPWRGTQLSIYVLPDKDERGDYPMPRVFAGMLKRGVVGDEREPSVIRLSPVALYNTFAEVGRCVEVLEGAMTEEVKYQQSKGESAARNPGKSVDLVSRG